MTQHIVRSLSAALNASSKYPFRHPEFDVDYLIIGGGVVGLAIARKLALNYPDKSTYLVERHARPGEETSSRNSEVIHGGFYYPIESLKTQLCIHGRKMLYDYCDTHAVPYRKVGKLVVGHNHQRSYLESLHRKASSLERPKIGGASPSKEQGPAVPVKLLSGDEARDLEPDLSQDIAFALLSSETGIVDTHTYMEALEKDITESGSGSVVCSTEVVRVDPTEGGWVVQMRSISSVEDAIQHNDSDSVLARTIINSTGLSAPFILNALYKKMGTPLPSIPIWYARGSYASYRGPGVSNVKHLIYPVPETGSSAHGFASLGTHLTIDLGGNIKFGPDIEWIEPSRLAFKSPTDITTTDPRAIDFWQEYLVASSEKIPSFFSSVRQYLPGIIENGLQPDYVGIRPKLGPPGSGFQDFILKKDFSGRFIGGSMREDEGGPIISLLGIESPGLTSSLAIAELVDEQLKAA